jgi:hypothetical protein
VPIGSPEPLKANTQYYWRVVATNESGTTTSLLHTFIYTTTSTGLDAGGLPDGRAYEMVTPNRKNGASIGGVSHLGLGADVAADGQRVIASAIQCFADAGSCNAQQEDGIGSPYEFTRTSGGWVTTPLAPPATKFTQGQSAAFGYSAQTGTALFGIPTAPLDEDDFYVRNPKSGEFEDLGPDTLPEAGAHGPRGGVLAGHEQAHTADFSHFAWDADYHWSSPFVETSGGSTHEVFEYAPGAENTHLDVGVSGGYQAGKNENLISGCGTNLGQARENATTPGGTISADGRTTYFTALPELGGGSCTSGAQEIPVPEVFARVNGEVGPAEAQQLGVSEAHTVAISEPSPSACGSGSAGAEVACRTAPAASAQFIAASEDGSDALFASTQQLTDGASEDPNPADSAAIDNIPHTGEGCARTVGANGCNLYLFAGVTAEHSSERHLLDVSAGENGAPVPNGPRVQGVLAASPNAGHVYFVAQGVLTSEERPGCLAEWDAAGRTAEADCHAEEGANNLYVYDTATARTSFITIMSASDLNEWREEEPGKPANVTPATPTTSDGQFLVFLSHGELTPDDTSHSGANQVFRYDAGSGGAGSLTRLSIGNEGFDDDGNRSTASACVNGAVQLECSEDANIVRGAEASRRDPSMSDDGSRVFFESPVALTPHALDDVQISDTTELLEAAASENMPLYAENVYEWEAAGTGTCEQASGCVFSISDGHDLGVTRAVAQGCSAGSAVCLLGTDETGKNVFFATTDQLVPSDTNTELDYYDARICEPANGNPCIESSSPPSACNGEECHGIPAPVPGIKIDPSQTFNGPGNAPPPVVTKKVTKKTGKCKRGFVKNKKHKCVRKPKKVHRKGKS